MDDYSEFFVWAVVAVAFAGGYSIVSFLASKMKSGSGRWTVDNDTAKASEGVDDRAKTSGQRSGESFQTEDGGQANMRQEESDTRRLEQSYAQILGLAQPIVPSEVKLAFRKSLAKYHPDKVEHLGDEFKQIAEKKTREVMEAYEYFRRKYRIK